VLLVHLHRPAFHLVGEALGVGERVPGEHAAGPVPGAWQSKTNKNVILFALYFRNGVFFVL
jgi:hypothetical protein